MFLFGVWRSVYALCGSNVWFILLLGHSPSADFGIDSAASSVIKKVNVLTLTKENASGSGKNFVAKLVAENVDDVPSEIAGERVWKNNRFFGDIRTDYNIEKLDFPENSLFL